MGQSTSKESLEEITTNDHGFSNRSDCLFHFYQVADTIVSPIATYNFAHNLGVLKNSENITFKDLLPVFNINENIDERLCVIMDGLLTRLSSFPFIHQPDNGVHYLGLKMGTLLISSPEMCRKFLNGSKLDCNKLLFLGLVPIEYKQDEKWEFNKNQLQNTYDPVMIVNEFDNLELFHLKIPASNMLLLLTFVTSISHFTLLKSKVNPQYIEEHWVKFQRGPALNILRTMNRKITVHNIKESFISYDQFNEAILNEFPMLFQGLHNLFHSLFEATHKSMDFSFQETSLFNLQVRAQLASSMKPEFVYANIIKLYSGKDIGFSMRALQSKVLKWNAPTLLILKGQLMADDDKNPRYRKFIEQEYPRLNNLQIEKADVTYVIYIDGPWKITNRDLFGGPNTKIVQIQPQQITHKASGDQSLGNVYFNVIGGGIGVGNKVQPTIKNSVKKYNPGNVSVTIDSSLEFGVFRNVGHGGLFDPGASYCRGKEEEQRFLIKDLEVWGCGGEDILKEQLEAWEWEEKESKRRQRINLKSLGEDRALLEMAGLVGQNQSGGSV